MTTWKGCLNFECPNASQLVSESEEQYCGECGDELQPVVTCGCGRALNVKWIRARLRMHCPPFCESCGLQLTEGVLARLLASNLRALCGQVTDALDATKTN